MKKAKCISKCTSATTIPNPEKAVREMKENNNGQRKLKHGITTMDGDVEAFRPTTPGHSPGVGHSLKN